MTPKKATAPSILGRAMLVNTSIGLWGARKHDAKVTEKVNDQMAKTRKAGRYHKRLFGGEAPTHSRLVNAGQVARSAHHRHTLPWEDAGWRLLPTDNYFEYTEAMRGAKAQFEEALEEFLIEYPSLITQSRERLGSMYRREDYPTVHEVRRKFHFDVLFGPVPAGDDFRVSLPKEELAAMTRGVEERVNQAVKDAMNDAWARLGNTVSKLRAKLNDGKHLRETMVERVGEVAEILSRLNLTKDPALEKACAKVRKDLANLDVGTLRDDEKVRAVAARKADEILAGMKKVYSPSK